eukprot:473182-Hanusia_phi.AAC.1
MGVSTHDDAPWHAAVLRFQAQPGSLACPVRSAGLGTAWQWQLGTEESLGSVCQLHILLAANGAGQ